MKFQYAPVKKRILSWLLDYLLILVYMGVMLAISLLVYCGVLGYVPTLNQTGMNLVSLALILPVMAYFIVTEAGKKHASFGKWKLELSVASVRAAAVRFRQVLVRNLVKFIPWQAAHMMIFNGIVNDWEITPYFTVTAAICYGLLALYLLLVFARKDHRGLHDLIAGTVVAAKDKISLIRR